MNRLLDWLRRMAEPGPEPTGGRHIGPSRYMPHQGAREKARRRRGGFHRKDY